MAEGSNLSQFIKFKACFCNAHRVIVKAEAWKNLSLEESQNLKTAEERQKSHIAEVLKQTAKKGVLQKAVEEQLQ
ncbi:hypothetical protein PAL_GLEAN10001292 [Pteropus alecto]|uniref:Uncharacterized protein n=1 Tax=Pteropus alecto TaxID=9402 RepID=L5KMC5_PTEAL|nr:hypothetical protein PAL_GLEAN10001292 [Pteropus alecto]